MNVLYVPSVVVLISYSMIDVSSSPNLYIHPQFLLHSIRKSSFDELHCPLQGYLCRREEHMKVIGHDNELMQKKLPLLPVAEHRIEEQACHAFSLEQRTLSPRACRNEVCIRTE